MIDFFNLYDSVISDEEETTATNHDDEDENKSSEDSGQEIDDREIELLMLTLPRMGRVFNEQKDDEHFMTSDEINHIANNDINLARRAIPRFGKRAIPRFGKRAIPRFGQKMEKKRTKKKKQFLMLNVSSFQLFKFHFTVSIN